MGDLLMLFIPPLPGTPPEGNLSALAQIASGLVVLALSMWWAVRQSDAIRKGRVGELREWLEDLRSELDEEREQREKLRDRVTEMETQLETVQKERSRSIRLVETLVTDLRAVYAWVALQADQARRRGEPTYPAPPRPADDSLDLIAQHDGRMPDWWTVPPSQ